ncbi:MAG: sugar kinase, partial [Deinococcus sp.]|nr:sugar kinase [Deinococcus sp.]
FDPNIRLKLWDAATARRHILPLLAQVDMVFPGLDEARLLLGEGEPEALLDRLLSLGPRVVALKLGAQGALAGNGTTRCVATPPAVTVIDPVGAGDAFDAAFLFGTLRGLSLGEQLRLAVAAGTITTTIPGDYEGLASYQELVTFAQGVQVREGI